MSEAERTIETPEDSSRPEKDETAPEQAAGPAEPAGEAGDGAGTGPAAPRRRRIGVLAGVAGFAFVLDLLTKIAAVEWLEHQRSIEVIGDWVRFSVIRNGGAAFGFGEALTVFLTAVAATVVVVIIRLARKLYSTPWAIALGMLLGGAFGNLTDRLFRAPGVFEGHVVDFISVQHFSVFNLADSAIVCGGILIVILSFRGLDPDGTVHKD
ncbi:MULTISPECIES: signal peptidase II [Streptomyces]|uniref:Lipoprotein signal peptidase n=1 Tax=Streptomyces cheonanensis TaxID=312720 RepID=A0ABN2UZM9_9ACTN|nr:MULTISPECIES: signal peptidase II [Streptomyces]QKV68347.1 signal peptidase II [Streptomyces harbinensis]